MEKIKLIEALCNEFGAAVEDNIQIPLLSHKERIAIRENILAMPLDLDARAFLRTVIAELSFCCKFGQKRTGEKCEDGCHYSGYTCFHTKTCISNRFPISVKLYAQSLGWLMGDTEVNINHIKTVMPYNLGHRLQLRDEYVSLKQFRTRKDSLQIHLAKEIVDEIYKRYTEQSSHIKSALSVAYQNLTGNAIDPIKGDHPVYEEIRRDIEEGIGWVNLFEDFKDYAYEITPGFTGPKVQAKKSLLDFMMEGYSSCLKLKRQDLIQMVENLQTNKAYKVAVDFIYDLEYEAEDIEAFFYELSKKNGGTIPLEESGLTGVYISAMLNHIDDEEIELNLKPLKQKIDFLGYQLPMGKTVRLKGDAGNFAGAELNGGDLKIEGSCGDWTGAGMKAGKLSITHDVGIKTGDWKTGGEIHVGGVIGSMGLHNHGGLVYQAHRLKKS
ncbi:MAG: hypothetical protein HQ517_08980 [SAR324 cluster bacterium]|nr:hypothetical protein [SAR324 cluster bacterium]